MYVDKPAVSEVVVAPDALKEVLARGTFPALDASSQSSMNSVRVRCTSSPARRTVPASGSTSRSPKVRMAGPSSAALARRRRARILAASSFGSKGLVT